MRRSTGFAAKRCVLRARDHRRTGGRGADALAALECRATASARRGAGNYYSASDVLAEQATVKGVGRGLACVSRQGPSLAQPHTVLTPYR